MCKRFRFQREDREREKDARDSREKEKKKKRIGNGCINIESNTGWRFQIVGDKRLLVGTVPEGSVDDIRLDIGPKYGLTCQRGSKSKYINTRTQVSAGSRFPFSLFFFLNRQRRRQQQQQSETKTYRTTLNRLRAVNKGQGWIDSQQMQNDALLFVFFLMFLLFLNENACPITEPITSPCNKLV